MYQRIIKKKLENLFKELNEKSIRYCHWKSNEHLESSFSGKTDFDLLIARENIYPFRDFLINKGMKTRYSTSDKVYPGMEDFIGFDEESGNLFHFHIHYKLILGRKNQKNYHIPIEDIILNSTQRHPIFPINIICPELELILLIIRSSLKVDDGLRLLKKILLRRSLFPKNIIKEFDYLQKHLNKDEFTRLSQELFPELYNIFLNFLNKSPENHSILSLLKIKRNIIKALEPYRMFTGKQFRSEIRAKLSANTNSRSWLESGGVTIAFIGADGSGKSTTTQEIKNWLGWKLSVKSIYMGLPKQKLEWAALSILTKLFKKLGFKNIQTKIDEYRWLYAARFRTRNYQKAQQLSNQGNIVLFDRYPLKELGNMDDPMDGPRISTNGLAGRKERHLYEDIDKPDYLILLDVSEKESLKRKGEQQIQQVRIVIENKVKAIKELISQDIPGSISIDTAVGKEKTLLMIKTKIWECL